ncbi:hypothetical protein BDW74DRAFT_182368 [Aspergillus multicolor]|uniref:uncharacterized protein n=1 Tax=Aspergillus multicolor TaxID=41759 RepID=UPI003CCDEE22
MNTIGDTGSIASLNSADQLPTPPPKAEAHLELLLSTEQVPYFHLSCSLPLTTSSYPVLFHPTKHICRLSGVAYYTRWDIGFTTLQAPWDAGRKLVRSEDSTKNMRQEDEDPLAIATALPQHPLHPIGDTISPARLMCILVHEQCWQLLRLHRVWALSGGNVEVILHALLPKRAAFYQRHTLPIRRDPGRVDAVSMEMDCDPFRCDSVKAMVYAARRKSRFSLRVWEPVHGRSYLSRLPPELLCLTAGFLASKDIVAVQDAMGLYLGDSFWRARIPAFYHEVREERSRKLDWQYLCLGLERLSLPGRLGGDSIQVNARRYVLGQLDDLAGVIAGKSNLESARLLSFSDVLEKYWNE